MGMSKKIYVGPYVRFPVKQKAKEVERAGKCCGQTLHSKYCGRCGLEVVPRRETIMEDVIDTHEAMEAIDEALYVPQDCSAEICPPGFHIWKPNGGNFGVDTDECCAAELTETAIRLLKSRIRDEYGEELRTLTLIYKAEPEILFGVLVWTS